MQEINLEFEFTERTVSSNAHTRRLCMSTVGLRDRQCSSKVQLLKSTDEADYLLRARILRRLRLSRRIRFFLHLARILWVRT